MQRTSQASHSWKTVLKQRLAHYSIYLCGGILLIILLHTYKLEKRTKIIISQMLGSMYAITDEIHQYFTPREKL